VKSAWTVALGLAFAVHVVPFWVVWQGGNASARTSQRPAHQNAVLSVRLVSLEPSPLLLETGAVTGTQAAPVAAKISAPRSVSVKTEADRSVGLPSRAPETRSALPAARGAPPRLFSAGELDRSPRPLAEISPEYPEQAGARSGRVVLRLVIGEDGVVELAEIVGAAPAGVFEESARAAFLAARFEPGLRGGLPVRSEMTIEVEFTAADRSGAGTARY